MLVSTFINERGIGAKPVRVESNPSMTHDKWSETASHWLVTIDFAERTIDVPFSQGSAHTKPPTAEDVLECLVLDARGYESAKNFEEWASEYGYDTDSRAVERTYQAVGELTKALRHLFWEDHIWAEFLELEEC